MPWPPAIPVVHPPQYTQQTIRALPGQQAVLASTDFVPFWLELVHWQGTTNVHWPRQTSAASPTWFIPIDGSGTLSGENWSMSECWLVDADSDIVVNSPYNALIAGVG